MFTRRNFVNSIMASMSAAVVGCGRPSSIEETVRPSSPNNEEALDLDDRPDFSTNETTLDGLPVEFDVPLLERVHAYDVNIWRTDRRNYAEKGFRELGLQLHRRLARGTSWCTPLNSVAFGGNGGDGFHFSFLVRNGRVDSTSPIIGSAPDYSAHTPLANVILARSFEDFIRLGLIRGYFGMYLFVHDRDLALAAYGSADWQQTDSKDPAGLGLDGQKRKITGEISAYLNLKPLLCEAAIFQALQDEFMPMLQFKQ